MKKLTNDELSTVYGGRGWKRWIGHAIQSIGRACSTGNPYNNNYDFYH